MSEKAFEEWAVLELMGHRRLAGRVSEETIGGAAFIRIDVPGGATQFYAPGAVYCITPTTQAIARAFAEGNRPQPVSRYEISAPAARPMGARVESDIADQLGDPDEDDDQGGPIEVEILPTDQSFANSPDAGDPACICSRCGKLIPEGEVPIRAFNDRRAVEYRYHVGCLRPAP